MTRQYRYIQWHEKEIKGMPEQGMTYREIEDALRKKGFLHLSVIRDLYDTGIAAYKTSTYPNEIFFWKTFARRNTCTNTTS